MKTNKNELRKTILIKRLNQSEKSITIKSQKIVNKIQNLKKYQSAKNILLYFPIKNEVNILALTKTKNKNFFLPIVKEKLLFYGKYDKECNLTLNKYQIPEPKKINKKKLDLIIVPAISFDKNKFRIGYGKGFYDKFLKEQEALKIGICFDFQVTEKIEIESFDEKCDIVITEINTYK